MEIIKSPKRGTYLTITGIVIMILIAYHLAVARPEMAIRTNSIDSVLTVKGAENTRVIYELNQLNKNFGELKEDVKIVNEDVKKANQNVLELYKEMRKGRK